MGELSLLPCGTASNEALHAEVKSGFLQTQQIHQSTLQLKLHILSSGKMLAHDAAMNFPALKQTPSSMVLARVLMQSMWSEAEWQAWSNTKDTASLRLAEKRT